jgi:hypothetical protein
VVLDAGNVLAGRFRVSEMPATFGWIAPAPCAGLVAPSTPNKICARRSRRQGAESGARLPELIAFDGFGPVVDARAIAAATSAMPGVDRPPRGT